MKYYFIIIVIVIVILYNIYAFNENNNINIRKSVNPILRRKILIDLYNMIIDAAERSNTKPFITYGTLLGYIRNKDLICYDYDLDFGININEWEQIKKEIIKYKSNIYKIDFKEFLKYKSVEIIHIPTRISADIFTFSINKNMYSRDVPKLFTRYYLNEKCVDFPINWIDPLNKVKFLDRFTYIPNQPINFLECYYGKNFITPDHKCNNDCTICEKNK